MTDPRRKNACRECDKAHRRATFLAGHDEMVEVFLAHGFEPIGTYPGDHAAWPSVHLVCGRPCAPYPANVKSRGGGCEACARELRGRNRQVDPKVAAAVMRAVNLEPLVPYPTSGKPWLCRCLVCGEHVTPTYDNVKAGVGGCRPCGRYGLDWDGPAMVYVLVHHAHLALKVGVAKARPSPGTASRVDLLCKRFGWVPYARVLVPTGQLAYRIERAVLRGWRQELHLPPHLRREDSEGHTETVSLDAVSEERALRQVLAAREALAATAPSA
jgi:hypothetical protein